MDKVSDAYTRSAKPCFQYIDINSSEADTPRTIGPEYVCHSIWNELRINDVFVSSGVAERNLAIMEAIIRTDRSDHFPLPLFESHSGVPIRSVQINL